MTKLAARTKLEKNGYKVVLGKQNYIATKHQRTYIATTLNGLLKKIF